MFPTEKRGRGGPGGARGRGAPGGRGGGRGGRGGFSARGGGRGGFGRGRGSPAMMQSPYAPQGYATHQPQGFGNWGPPPPIGWGSPFNPYPGASSPPPSGRGDAFGMNQMLMPAAPVYHGQQMPRVNEVDEDSDSGKA